MAVGELFLCRGLSLWVGVGVVGASFEVDVYRGSGSVGEAFSALVQKARYDYGADPYNGTISTAGGYRVISDEPVPLCEAYRLADDAAAGSLCKRGDWVAVPLCETERIQVTVDVAVRGAEASMDTADVFARLRDKAKSRVLSRRSGWFAGEVRVLSWERILKPPRVFSKGRVLPVWVVDTGRFGEEKVFPSKAQAVSFAKEAASSVPVSGTRDFIVGNVVTLEKQFRTVDNARGLCSVVADAKSFSASVEVVLERPLKGGRRSGWLFAGWASS